MRMPQSYPQGGKLLTSRNNKLTYIEIGTAKHGEQSIGTRNVTVLNLPFLTERFVAAPPNDMSAGTGDLVVCSVEIELAPNDAYIAVLWQGVSANQMSAHYLCIYALMDGRLVCSHDVHKGSVHKFVDVCPALVVPNKLQGADQAIASHR